MSWRNTLLLLAVAALLGVGIWLSNRQQSEKHEAEEQAKRLFGSLEAGQIEWIALTTSDGREARLVRKDGAWRVAEPVDFPADPTAADGIASGLATLTSEAVIEEPQPPAVYGLGEGVRTVRFSANGQEHELRIGKKTPVGSNTYAATGAGDDAKVYTVATYKTTAFDKPLDDLRERRPLRFDREAVRRIEAEWTGGRVVVEKQDGHWKLVEPIAGDADDDTVETLLSDLAFLRASGFVDAPPPPAEVGLDRPEYRVVLVGTAKEGEPGAEGTAAGAEGTAAGAEGTAGGAEGTAAGSEGTEAPRWELAIGGVIEANARAGKAAEPALYKIPEDRFQKLPKKVEAFRFKQLASFVASDAERFELVFPDLEAAKRGESNVVTITGTRTENGWETAPEAMAPGKAAQLVAELARLDAADIAAEEVGPQELVGLGLSPPHATIRVYGKPAEEQVEEGGKPRGPVLADLQLGVQSGNRIVARRADRSTIFRMDASHAEHVPVSLEAFRNRFVAKEQPPAPAEPPATETPATEPPAAD